MIFGEYELAKYELGLTKTDDLILHGHHDQAGGLLIILSGGRTYNINKTFKRL